MNVLELSIMEALAGNPRVPPDEISVEAFGGDAILRGTVGSVVQREEAVRTTRHVTGVNSVTDRLRIGLLDASRRADADTEAAVLDALNVARTVTRARPTRQWAAPDRAVGRGSASGPGDPSGVAWLRGASADCARGGDPRGLHAPPWAGAVALDLLEVVWDGDFDHRSRGAIILAPRSGPSGRPQSRTR